MLRSETHRYREYATAICLTLGLLPWVAIHQTVQSVYRARLAGKQVLVVGSDGSQVAANHIALTLNKIARSSGCPDTFVSVLIDSNSPGNTEIYTSAHEDAAIDELARSIAPGDVVIVVSNYPVTSCVPKALRAARSSRAVTILWECGESRELDELADISAVIPDDCRDQAELAYVITASMVADALHALETG